MKPWTSANQKKMYDSRVNAAKLLLEACAKYKTKLKTFISASAIGYYSSDGDDWEESAYKFQKNNVRVVCMRISLLLDLKSGFLKPLILSAKLGIGTIFGNKSNITEWIHINDAAKFVSYALNNSNIDGSYNLPDGNDFISCIKNLFSLSDNVFP